MGNKSAKSYRRGHTVLLKNREVAPPAPSPCRVTRAHFPTPAEALGMGWTPAQIMAGCRRVPREDLTDGLHARLLAAELTERQIAELFCYSKAYANRIRLSAEWNKPPDECGAEEALDLPQGDDAMEDDDMAAAIKLASLEEARQYGIKLPESREEKKDMSMTFAKALVIGMPPREALETCLPSRLKDITKELLQACVDGGLTRDEIAKGFGTTMSSLVWKASQVNFKFPDGRKRQQRETPGPAGEAGAANQGAGGEAPLTPGAAAGNAPPGAAAITGGSPPAPPAPEPDDWAFTFGEGRKETGPELAIYSDGRIMIRKVSMPVDTQYLFKFNRDFTMCRIESSPEGVKVHWKGTEGIESRIRPLANQFHKLGMKFTVRYRLDPATLIGERVGADAAVQA